MVYTGSKFCVIILLLDDYYFRKKIKVKITKKNKEVSGTVVLSVGKL